MLHGCYYLESSTTQFCERDSKQGLMHTVYNFGRMFDSRLHPYNRPKKNTLAPNSTIIFDIPVILIRILPFLTCFRIIITKLSQIFSTREFPWLLRTRRLKILRECPSVFDKVTLAHCQRIQLVRLNACQVSSLDVSRKLPIWYCNFSLHLFFLPDESKKEVRESVILYNG